MAQWSMTDDAAGSPIWAPAKFGQAPTRANANTMYGNTTGNGYVTGMTIGGYGVGEAEMNLAGVFHVTAATPNNAGNGGYLPGETLTVSNTGAGDTNTITQAVLTVSDVEIATMAINGLGTGGSYVAGSLLRLANGVSTVNATANITGTMVRSVAVIDGGTGYANGDTIRPSTGTQTTNAVFTVTTGAADTVIASLALTGNGVFTVNPTLANGATVFITGTGTGARVTVTMKIKTISAVATKGAYTTTPTLTAASTTPASGDGTGATVDVTTAIKTLAVTTPGVYTKQTNVTAAALAGGTGTGATAVLTEPSGEPEGKRAGMVGWSVRTEGTGGRAGRVQYELLVAGTVGTSTSDDPVLPQ